MTPPPPIGTFPKIHPIWQSDPSLRNLPTDADLIDETLADKDGYSKVFDSVTDVEESFVIVYDS